MIVGVFGLPGSGKTTFLTYAAICGATGKALAAGRATWRVSLSDFSYDRIFTNFPVALPKKLVKKQKCPFFQLNPRELGKYDFSRSLVIIDEISLCLDGREWKNFSNDLKQFFALCRHYKTDIIYASQSYDHADKRIRDITSVLLSCDRRGSWTLVRPIHKQWSVDGAITEGYTLAPPLSSLWLRRKPFYTAFDSYSAPTLPENPSLQW